MANSTFSKVHELNHMFGPSNSHRDEFQGERAYTSTHQSPAEGLLFLLQAAQELEEQPVPVASRAPSGDQNTSHVSPVKHAHESEPDVELAPEPVSSPAAVHHRVPHDSPAQPAKNMAAQHTLDGHHYGHDSYVGFQHGGQDSVAMSGATQIPHQQYQHVGMSGGMQHYPAHQMPQNSGMYATQMFPQAQSYMHHAQAQAHAHAQAQAHAHAQAQAQAHAHAQMSVGYVAGAQQYQHMHHGHMMHPGQQPTYVAAAQQHAMMMQHQAAAQAQAAAYGSQHPHAYS